VDPFCPCKGSKAGKGLSKRIVKEGEVGACIYRQTAAENKLDLVPCIYICVTHMCVCFAAGWRRSSPTRPSESASEFSSSKTARKLRRSCRATAASPTSRRTTRCSWPASVAKDTPSATFPVSKLPFQVARSLPLAFSFPPVTSEADAAAPLVSHTHFALTQPKSDAHHLFVGGHFPVLLSVAIMRYSLLLFSLVAENSARIMKF